MRTLPASLRRMLLVTSLVFALWVILVFLAKDGDVQAFRLHLSAYRSDWPFALALLLAVLYAALARVRIADDLRWASQSLDRRAPWFAGLIALCAASASALWGAHVAGGADAYGYVSQADLWIRRQLVVPQPFAGQFAWPDLVFAPLGYRPGLEPHTIVPTYPPGLPMLMAAGRLALGPCGVHIVVPISAAVVVLATYAIGAWVCSRVAGAASALLVACSPAMLYMSMSPMADVPVSAAWAVAMMWLLRAGLTSTIAAGLATAVTILIRPNLAPLAIVGTAVLLLQHRREGWRRARVRAIVYAVAVLPGVVTIAVLNQHLYGSPFLSGHGDLRPHFAWHYGALNARLYTSWLVRTETPAVLLAVLPLIAGIVRPRSRMATPALVLLYGTIATVAVSYLFFRPFDDWWWLRYWLPAFPALLVAMVTGAAMLLRRLPFAGAVAAGFIGVVAVSAFELHIPIQARVFRPATPGARFEVFGRYVNAHTPRNAVILAMEHSGSLRYYGGRMTIRYDWLDDLDAAASQLRKAGYRPYLALDASERAGFERRFAARSRLGRLDWPPIFELVGPSRVQLYDLTAYEGAISLLPPERAPGNCAPAADRVAP